MDNESPFSLKGRIVVITGGGTGLGLGMADCYVKAGARVVLIGRRESILQQAVQKLGDNATYYVHDITALQHNQELTQKIETNIGPIDCLVNNAGNHLKKPALETTDEEFLSVLNTHLLAAHSLTRAVATLMTQRQSGTILFVSSMAAFMGVPLVLAYTTAKTALLGLVRGLTAELSPHGIRINAIAPGWIQSEMLENALAGDSERKQKIMGRTPLVRLGEPKDIGHAAVYLTSNAAKFVTGTVLVVDGGAQIGF